MINFSDVVIDLGPPIAHNYKKSQLAKQPVKCQIDITLSFIYISNSIIFEYSLMGQ